MFWPGLEAFIRLCLSQLLLRETTTDMLLPEAKASAASHLTEIIAAEAEMTPGIMGLLVEVI